MATNIYAKIENELSSAKVHGDKNGQYCLWVRDRFDFNKRIFWRFEEKLEAISAVEQLQASGKYAYVLKDGVAGEILYRSEEDF